MFFKKYKLIHQGENPTLASEEPPVEEPEEVTEKPSVGIRNALFYLCD